ncbi:MAG: hypothetical protein JOZ78_27380 [Chroococcidiopsidaceae cyanobacterium CP_BM_ER_R8_30]|nr:hypothetical protein [Chroococcidiopsidaceae cyanobacterium CP_BM_ER_R8_30]
MNIFDLLADSIAQPDTVTSVTEQPSDVLPVSRPHQAVAPTSTLNYLSLTAILLVLAGMIGVTVRAAGLKLKPNKSSQRSTTAASNPQRVQAQIEILERIWKMSPQNVED